MNCYGLRVVTNVSPDGTITLPEQIRNCLGLKPFDDLVFTVENGAVIAAKVTETHTEYEIEE